MRVGVDSYCFHRYFGEVYEGLQRHAATSWSIWDFLTYAGSLPIESVSLETCFLPPLDETLLTDLRDHLDQAGVDCVLAWGHPTGLDCGRDDEALDDLVHHIAVARRIGATVMRIVGGNASCRQFGVEETIGRLTPVLHRAYLEAEAQGVKLAIENHNDFTARELLRLLDRVSSSALGVTLDTGNAIRVHDDPIEATRILAPYAFATHLKDIAVHRGSPVEFSFWRSCPVGQGIIDIPAIIWELRQARYDGALTVEIDLVHPRWDRLPEETIVRESVAFVHQALADIETGIQAVGSGQSASVQD
jgi:sugar phosphate isomerase/epimerase